MEAVRFVTHQTQVLQVHCNSAKFAFNFVKPENLKETLYPQELRSFKNAGKRKKEKKNYIWSKWMLSRDLINLWKSLLCFVVTKNSFLPRT